MAPLPEKGGSEPQPSCESSDPSAAIRDAAGGAGLGAFVASALNRRRKMSMNVEYQLLAERPDAVLIIANWLHGEWGHEVEGSSAEKLAEGIGARMSIDRFPMHVIAIQGDDVVGFGALKIREMKIYQHREHWLGSLFVPVQHRGKGIASGLIEEIVRRGQERGVSLLSLQTEQLEGGLYLRSGWKPVEQVHYRGLDVLVMERFLDGTGSSS